MEDVTSLIVDATSHMEDVAVHIEALKAHTAPVTIHIEAATAHTATTTSHTAPGTITPVSNLPRLLMKNKPFIIIIRKVFTPLDPHRLLIYYLGFSKIG